MRTFAVAVLSALVLSCSLVTAKPLVAPAPQMSSRDICEQERIKSQVARIDPRHIPPMIACMFRTGPFNPWSGPARNETREQASNLCATYAFEKLQERPAYMDSTAVFMELFRQCMEKEIQS